MTAELDLSVSSTALSSEPTSGFSVYYTKFASQISSSSSSPPRSSNVDSATSRPNSYPKPLTSQATEPGDEDPKDAIQPTVDELAKLGIKVRDFAYESKLPAIRPYRPARQVQPGPRPLKRMRIDEKEDEEFSQGSSAGRGMRTSGTRDVLTVDTTFLPRSRGFADLNSYDHLTDSQPLPYSQHSERSSPSQSQPPLEYIESQGSEPYITTPFVTPNGSLQWQVNNTSSIPASQLDINPPHSGSDHLTEPKPLPGRDLPLECDLLSSPVPLSDLELPQLSSPRGPQRHRSLSPSPAEIDTPPPPRKKQRGEPSASPCPPKSSSPPLPVEPSSPPQRYHLRTRRAPAASQSPPKPASRGRPQSRSRKNGSLAPPAAGPFSVRSAHSQSPKKTQVPRTPRTPRAKKKVN